MYNILEMIKKGFGNRLGIIRLASCKSQIDVSSACKIPQSSLSVIEKGNYSPREDVRAKIAKIIRCNLYWLDTGDSGPFSNMNGIIKLNSCRKRKSE